MISLDLGSGGEPGITLDRVEFFYDSENVVNELSWELDQGKCAVITGASGCGKSTLLQIAAGLLPCRRGTVLMAGHAIGKLLPSERVRRGLRTGFVFQDGGLFSNMDVYSNVSLALYYHQDVLGLSDDDVTTRTEYALDAAQIERAQWQTLPAHLSFGDRKRLALARALCLKPNYFFFDDPDVGNDQRTAKVTHQILCELRDDPEITLMVATNRTTLIERLGIPGYQMSGGTLNIATAVSSFPPSIGSGRKEVGPLSIRFPKTP